PSASKIGALFGRRQEDRISAGPVSRANNGTARGSSRSSHYNDCPRMRRRAHPRHNSCQEGKAERAPKTDPPGSPKLLKILGHPSFTGKKSQVLQHYIRARTQGQFFSLFCGTCCKALLGSEITHHLGMYCLFEFCRMQSRITAMGPRKDVAGSRILKD